MEKNIIYLDTETTGLNRNGDDRIVEISVIGDDGETLLDTLINPGIPIPEQATAVHGITDEMVADAPSLEDIVPKLISVISGQILVIYNSDYDTSFLPKPVVDSAEEIKCAMSEFSPIYGDWNDYHQNYKWQSLETAAKYVGHKWKGEKHRALSDCFACRAVWKFLQTRRIL